MASRKTRAAKVASVRALIDKLRKPLAPPTLTHLDERKYSRSRERERTRRAETSDPPVSDKT